MKYNYEGDTCGPGRIHEDESIDRGINMWIVSDNVRKNVALNAIQIAKKLL